MLVMDIYSEDDNADEKQTFAVELGKEYMLKTDVKVLSITIRDTNE